jgi:hypothetical protein
MRFKSILEETKNEIESYSSKHIQRLCAVGSFFLNSKQLSISSRSPPPCLTLRSDQLSNKHLFTQRKEQNRSVTTLFSYSHFTHLFHSMLIFHHCIIFLFLLMLLEQFVINLFALSI